MPYFSLLTFHISQSQAHVEDLNEVERNLEERNKVCKEIESQRVLAEKRYGIPILAPSYSIICTVYYSISAFLKVGRGASLLERVFVCTMYRPQNL